MITSSIHYTNIKEKLFPFHNPNIGFMRPRIKRKITPKNEKLCLIQCDKISQWDTLLTRETSSNQYTYLFKAMMIWRRESQSPF